MQPMVSSEVWQRRTHKIIAMAVIIIGLTMMISTIPQCIYIGLFFLMVALGWLGWMRMKEKKAEPPNPTLHQPHASLSPVLFLVASQNFTQRACRPTPVDPNDKPPSYDQILKLDGLPPDYLTILAAMPPRYEDIEGIDKHWTVAMPVDVDSPVEGLPRVHSYRAVNSSSSSSSSMESSSSSQDDSDTSSYHSIEMPHASDVDIVENSAEDGSTKGNEEQESHSFSPSSPTVVMKAEDVEGGES